MSGFSATFSISHIAFQWSTSFCSSCRTAGLFLLVSYTPVVSVWCRPTEPLTHEWLVHRPLLVLTMGCQREHFRGVFIFPIHNPSTKFLPVHICFYPSKWRVDGSLHKAMVWWHQDGRNMCGIVTPGVEASFSTVVCLSMCWHHHTCVALSTGGLDFEVDKEPLTVRPPRHRCFHQEPTGSLWGMQFSFSLDVSSDIYIYIYIYIYICATKSMKTL